MAVKKAIPLDISFADLLKRALPKGYKPTDVQSWISTGCDILDWTLGGRGFPTGRVHEIYGPEHSGRTMLALIAARSTYAMNGEVAYLDVESGLDLGWVRKLGVDPKQLDPQSPLWLEEVQSAIEMIVDNRQRADTPTLIVVDSIAVALARDYVESPVGDVNNPAMEARLNARFFGRSWMTKMRESNICLLLINQPRDKINARFGPQTGTPGGRVLRHAACIRMSIRKGHSIEDEGKNIVGHRVACEIIKNKTTGRLLTAEVSTYLDRGIDNLETSIAYAFDNHGSSNGRLDYAGKSWYRRDLKNHLCTHLDEVDAFREHVRQLWLGGSVNPFSF